MPLWVRHSPAQVNPEYGRAAELVLILFLFLVLVLVLVSHKISGRAFQTAKILTADDADLRRYGIQTRKPQSSGV